MARSNLASSCCAAGLSLALLAAPAFGQPFVVPLDTNLSSMTIELCIQGMCDWDTSPLAGTISIELDAANAPTQITLHDFNVQATQDLSVTVDLGFLAGRVDATARNLSTTYAGLNPMGPNPINANLFSFTDVPTDLGGTIDFQATNIICFSLAAIGICTTCPCSETIILANQGTQLADFSGNITAVNGLVTLSGQIDTTLLFDPGNPSFGHIRVTGMLVGQTQITTEICGDANCDGTFNGGDIDPFFLAVGDPAAWQIRYPGCNILAVADINHDGRVNGGDIDPFFQALVAGECLP